MRIILTILLLAFTTTFAFANDLNEMKKGYDYLYKYKNSSSWKKRDCGAGIEELQPIYDKYFTACYYTHSESGDFAIIREVYREERDSYKLDLEIGDSQIELFLPDDKVVLDRRQRPDGTSVWNQEDDDTYLVEQSEGKWLVSRRGLLLYATEGMEDALQATFLTDDNQEIQAVFYQRAGVVQLMFDTEKILLKQYRTASGYGYSNPLYDLRGKGREALLTRLSDGKKYALKEK